MNIVRFLRLKMIRGYQMSKGIIKNTYRFTLLFTLLLSNNCFANPIIIDPGAMVSKIWSAILINSSVDLGVLVIGYALIKRFYHVISWEFIKYLFYVIIMGFAVDAIVLIVLEYMGIYSRSPSIPSIGFAFIFLAIGNLILCRSYWGLCYRNSAIIGIMMGILTNPYIVMILF